MNLTLRQLRESGLPIDWMTIKVGYDGFDSSWQEWHLRRDEIPGYALDVLASAVGTPDEELIFQIADADPTNRMVLDRPLALLAERANVTREIALRKWRYASIHEFVRTFQPLSYTNENDEWVSEYYGIHEFKSNWNGVISTDPLPEIANIRNAEDALAAEIALLRAWLSEEYSVLS